MQEEVATGGTERRDRLKSRAVSNAWKRMQGGGKKIPEQIPIYAPSYVAI